MTAKRAEEIAKRLAERELLRRGIPDPEEFKRDVAQLAQDIDVPVEELKEFSELLMPRLIGKIFCRRQTNHPLS